MKDWQQALIGPDTQLEEAIRVIDHAAMRIALVVDNDRHLLGTLTDGDIRRALLKHTSLSAPVSEVMFTRPKTAGQNWSRARILSLLEQHSLLQIPIVDERQRVVGLESIHNVLYRPRRDNPVFLMAGGLGTRLKPLTNHCPKPLLKVGNKPILEQILENFVSAGFHRFYLSTHYLPEMIRDHFGDGSRWDASIQYVHEEIPLGTGGALGLLPHDEIDVPLLMMNGDLLTSVNFVELLEFHQSHGGVATMATREYEQQVPYGVIQPDGNRIAAIQEKPVQKFFVNAGIYVLNPELVHQIPSQTRIDMPDLLSSQIDAGHTVSMFPIHEYWLDIGRMNDFQQAQQDYQEVFVGK